MRRSRALRTLARMVAGTATHAIAEKGVGPAHEQEVGHVRVNLGQVAGVRARARARRKTVK